jgi:hypothetical protein
MSEKLNINDFKSDHGDISRLESDTGDIRVLTVELLKLKNQIALLSNELKVVKDGRQLISVTREKTEVSNWLYTNDEYVSVPIGTVIALDGNCVMADRSRPITPEL